MCRPRARWRRSSLASSRPPGLNQFLQEDRFADPRGDIALAADPLTSSRYALTGGNPSTSVEANGHGCVMASIGPIPNPPPEKPGCGNQNGGGGGWVGTCPEPDGGSPTTGDNGGANGGKNDGGSKGPSGGPRDGTPPASPPQSNAPNTINIVPIPPGPYVPPDPPSAPSKSAFGKFLGGLGNAAESFAGGAFDAAKGTAQFAGGLVTDPAGTLAQSAEGFGHLVTHPGEFVDGCLADLAHCAGEQTFGLVLGGGAGKFGELRKLGESAGDEAGVVGRITDQTVCPNGHSFGGNTLVTMGDGTLKPIRDVQIGDTVIAVDPRTGARHGRRVNAVWKHRDELLVLGVGDTSIETTSTHRFWDATRKHWVEAGTLQSGDSLPSAVVGPLRVSPEAFGRSSGVGYDLTVDRSHTFLVGVAAVLVHNCTPGPDGVPSLAEGSQGKHIRGHNNYTPGRSYLTVDPNELLSMLGRGSSLNKIPHGEPGSRERVDFGRSIGFDVDPDTGLEYETSVGTVHYGKKGVHIVPVARGVR